MNQSKVKSVFIFAGTREDRAVNSLLKMGPAIINGGVTTFLALLLLGFSSSHVFITFFKVIQSDPLTYLVALLMHSLYTLSQTSIPEEESLALSLILPRV